MNWVKELKELVGVTDEGYAANLNDVEGREILGIEHFQLLRRIKQEEAKNDSDICEAGV